MLAPPATAAGRDRRNLRFYGDARIVDDAELRVDRVRAGKFDNQRR